MPPRIERLLPTATTARRLQTNPAAPHSSLPHSSLPHSSVARPAAGPRGGGWGTTDDFDRPHGDATPVSPIRQISAESARSAIRTIHATAHLPLATPAAPPAPRVALSAIAAPRPPARSPVTPADARRAEAQGQPVDGGDAWVVYEDEED
jgi:hypothetical protein